MTTADRISHEETIIASLKRDPAFAVEFLNAMLADGDREEMLLSLGREEPNAAPAAHKRPMSKLESPSISSGRLAVQALLFLP